jgi:hypothetical protein
VPAIAQAALSNIKTEKVIPDISQNIGALDQPTSAIGSWRRQHSRRVREGRSRQRKTCKLIFMQRFYSQLLRCRNFTKRMRISPCVLWHLIQKCWMVRIDFIDLVKLSLKAR